MQPQYSQSRRENATPSSGTSPLAFYKEVHPRGPRLDWQFQWLFSNTHLATWLFSNTYLASSVGVIFLPPVVRKEIRLLLKRLLGRLQYTRPYKPPVLQKLLFSNTHSPTWLFSNTHLVSYVGVIVFEMPLGKVNKVCMYVFFSLLW